MIEVAVKDLGKDVSIKIKDNGIGMDSDELEMIYTRFYQIDKSHSQEGSGLGLSIVKSIIDLSDGKIEVESKENSGTTFTIKLPIEKENNNSKAQANKLKKGITYTGIVMEGDTDWFVFKAPIV